MPARRVLITGFSNFWGLRLARRLANDPDVEAVIGLDDRRPADEAALPNDFVFVEGDLRSPDVAGLVRAAAPDTVVHNALVQFPGEGRSSRTVHDLNVVGTLQLLSACDQLPQLETVVVRASAAIYGTEAGSPAFFSEDMAGSATLRTRFQRDLGDLESYVEAFARRHPDVCCTTLRLQPVVGPTLVTPVTRLLRLPVIPTVLGFDPRLQVLHEDDSVEALAQAVRRPVRGAVNVAGRGTISLSAALRRLRRRAVGVPHPLFGSVAGRLGFSEEMIRYLRYGRGVEIERLTRELGYEPRPTVEALEATGA